MPADILIYAIIAAVMVIWLRSVLGTRHGEERERPNPFEGSDLPNQNKKKETVTPDGKLEPIDAEPAKGGDVDSGLVQIALADKNFDTKQFKENAADAFHIIVTAFADGDRDTLRDLCSDDVYRAFDNALKERAKKGEKVTTEIHAIRKTEIVDAGVDQQTKEAFVGVRFTADETYVIEDKDGNLIAGHPDRVTEMIDKWTFTRKTKSSDPRWFLSKTEDDVVEEDGKTPLPDAG